MNWAIFNEYVGQLDKTKQAQLLKFKDLLRSENKKYNLTTIIDDEEILYKHFLDSILFTKEFELTNQKLLDIGTGAGFPGLVLKILFPNTKVYLIESNGKKVNFLNLVIQTLGLTDIWAIDDRAEEFSVNHQEEFDVVISRAMAPLNILLEVGVQAIKVGGYFICLKAKNVNAEILELNGKEANIALKLEKEQKLFLEKIGERVNLFFKKVSTTNKIYPRLYSQIKKKPLGK